MGSMLPAQRSLAHVYSLSARGVHIPASASVPALFFTLSAPDGRTLYRSDTVQWTANPTWALSWVDICTDKAELAAVAGVRAFRFRMYAQGGSGRGAGLLSSLCTDSEEDGTVCRPLGTLFPTEPTVAPEATLAIDEPVELAELVFLPFNLFAALASVGRVGTGVLGPGGRRVDKGADKDAGGRDEADAELTAAEGAGYSLDALPLNMLVFSLDDGDYLLPAVHRALARPAVSSSSGGSSSSEDKGGIVPSAQGGSIPRPPAAPSSSAAPAVVHDLRRAFDATNRLMQLKREIDGVSAATDEALASLASLLADNEKASAGVARRADAALAAAARIAALNAEAARLEAECAAGETLAEREGRLDMCLADLHSSAVAVGEASGLLPEVGEVLSHAANAALSLRGMVAAKQLSLLAELRSLYPIAEQDKGRRWSIRGCVLPSERDFASAPDEAVSTALGYTAHTVSLAAKYLSVPLRYAPQPTASSSSIRDEVITNTRVFPLYGKAGGPGGDKEAQQVGARMLSRDVKQLLASQGLSYSDGAHVLANLARLFAVLLDAPLPDSA